MGKYDFNKVEERLKQFWKDKKVYKFNPNKKNIYSIDTPPPTVSGKMHIGHAFSYSQQDFIARFRRMKQGVFYPFGTDDNGLPTERLIEKMKKVKSKNMSRAEFIELCLKTLKEITPGFIQDWRDLAISADYDICYSTIDDNSRKISQKSFIDLYKQGIAYRKDFPTLWCPECQTSIAQAELEDKEGNSLFSTLKFSVDNNELLIATTRPELLPGCVAVFVNPNDKRYKSLVGKKAKVPLFDLEVPIIEDESAEMEKGTGVLMICSYGDRFDVDAINRHKLNPRIVLDEQGVMNELAGEYNGLKIKEARKKILQDLEKKGLIKEQKKINHVVNTHDKCGTDIEFISTEQWFIRVLDKKKQLVKQGKKINWYPDFMFKRYKNWVEGLEWDWSISRDRHFGIPIPVWYCDNCNEILVADEKELPVDPLQVKKKCSKCGKQARAEESVLDTWATSSLTPMIASSLVDNKIKFPYSLRPQAHDIIRTWAFYTITKALYHKDKLPWEEIMVSGFVTLKGEKMSKSKGNVVDPKKVLQEFGADALRFWAAGSKLGEDLDYQEQDLVAGKKFINKLWNASNFVFMNLEDYKGDKPKKLEELDIAFLNKLNSLVKSVTESFENYEYSKAKADAEEFFWQDFCDNYLEIVKKRVYQGEGDKRLSAQYTLYKTLLVLLKLFAPITPFITEEIYQNNFKKVDKEESIHVSEWPGFIKESDYKLFDSFVEVLGKIRHKKTSAQKPMNSECVVSLDKEDYAFLESVLDDLKNVTNAKEIKSDRFSVEF